MVTFSKLCRPLHDCYCKDNGTPAYPVETAFKCLLFQQWEDLSDRQMERYLQENNSAKLFCGFDLTDSTPGFMYFSKTRSRIGYERLANMFNTVTDQLKKQKLVSNIFTFVDATGIISKVSLWNERDKAIEDILPPSGMVFADKEYDTNATNEILEKNNLHSGITKKNNRKNKDRDKDRWLTSV